MRQSQTLRTIRPLNSKFMEAWGEYEKAHAQYRMIARRRQSILMSRPIDLLAIGKVEGDSKAVRQDLLDKEATLKTTWKVLKSAMRKQNQNMR